MLDNINSSFILAAWLLLFPLTYLAHIAEEYWGGDGYSKYLLTNFSVELSPQRFLVLHALGVFLMGSGVVLGIALRFPLTMIAILSSIILGNALVHTIRSVHSRMYSPGLITAAVLWLPLGLVSLLAAWSYMSAGKLTVALAVGFIANFIVELITTRSPSSRMRNRK
jgi:uncharacterized protein with HXXEE motif